jgi:hypothetical protein
LYSTTLKKIEDSKPMSIPQKPTKNIDVSFMGIDVGFNIHAFYFAMLINN